MQCAGYFDVAAKVAVEGRPIRTHLSAWSVAIAINQLSLPAGFIAKLLCT